MIRSILCLALSLAALDAGPAFAQRSPLVGTWTEISGPGAARIEPCPTAANALCGIGLARRAGGAPGRVETGRVLSDVVPDGSNRWKGTYIDGQRRLPATIRLLNPSTVEMKVCIFVICRTVQYRRSA